MGPRRKKKLFGAGLGAGLLGAIFLALRYAVRPAAKGRVPDTISPAIFRTKALHTSLGQVVYHESGSGPTLVFIHATCDEPVAIVASGLGGGLSVLVASQHPEVVRQLILWMPIGLTEKGV